MAWGPSMAIIPAMVSGNGSGTLYVRRAVVAWSATVVVAIEPPWGERFGIVVSTWERGSRAAARARAQRTVLEPDPGAWSSPPEGRTVAKVARSSSAYGGVVNLPAGLAPNAEVSGPRGRPPVCHVSRQQLGSLLEQVRVVLQQVAQRRRRQDVRFDAKILDLGARLRPHAQGPPDGDPHVAPLGQWLERPRPVQEP